MYIFGDCHTQIWIEHNKLCLHRIFMAGKIAMLCVARKSVCVQIFVRVNSLPGPAGNAVRHTERRRANTMYFYNNCNYTADDITVQTASICSEQGKKCVSLPDRYSALPALRLRAAWPGVKTCSPVCDPFLNAAFICRGRGRGKSGREINSYH